MAVSTNISSFLAEVAKRGGIASSNSYDVQFIIQNQELLTQINAYGSQTSDNFMFTRMLCNEVQIPGIVFASADIKGPYKGLNARMPYAKIYNSLDMSFVCDMESVPYRFFRAWQDFISNGIAAPVGLSGVTGIAPVNSRRVERKESFYFRYYDDYVADIEIYKLEKNSDKTIANKQFYNPYVVALRRAYPYSVTSIPLSAASSQLVKLTVSMYYEYSDFVSTKSAAPS